MIAIYKKEIRSFFNTAEGYLSISVFFIINALILWFIPSEYNITYNYQASLLPFFLVTPWILLLLIPSITMKMISAESLEKTTIILFTKPIEKWSIINSKFLASITISILSILPSFIFIYSIYELSEPRGNIDWGELIGSYIGLVMLISTYSSIGIFGSTLSKNTMVSFILTILIILFFLIGLNELGNSYNSEILQNMSITHHYEAMRRGVVDSRSVIYFISIIMLFLSLSVFVIKEYKT